MEIFFFSYLVLDLDPKLYKYIAKSYFECKEYAKTANKTWDVDVNNGN